MKLTIIFTSDLVIPGYSDLLFEDITKHDLTIVNYKKKVVCHTELPVILNRYKDDPRFNVLLTRFSSPKEQRFVRLEYTDEAQLTKYLFSIPGTTDLNRRLSALHTGILPYDQLIPFLIPETECEGRLFTAIGFGASQK